MSMSDVTRILNAIEGGDPKAANELLPLVYDELRLLASQKMAQERPGQTLQATALVHEAYLRLVGTEDQEWDNRGHFFKAAAEAMRRILVDNARRKGRMKHGAGHQRIDLTDGCIATEAPPDTLIALDEALTQLDDLDADATLLIKLTYFGGFSLEEAAEALKITPRTAYRHLAFARAWLYDVLAKEKQQ
jgi:RNA polymerase sigma factor (TIGR02999 family)